MFDLLDQYVGEELRSAPVADQHMSRRMLLTANFTDVELNKARRSCKCFDKALRNVSDREILERC